MGVKIFNPCQFLFNLQIRKQIESWKKNSSTDLPYNVSLNSLENIKSKKADFLKILHFIYK